MRNSDSQEGHLSTEAGERERERADSVRTCGRYTTSTGRVWTSPDNHPRLLRRRHYRFNPSPVDQPQKERVVGRNVSQYTPERRRLERTGLLQ